MEKNIVEDPLRNQMIESTLKRMTPVTVRRPFIAQIIEKSSGTIFGKDSHYVRLLVEGHGSGHFRRTKRNYIDLRLIFIAQRPRKEINVGL